MLVIRSIIFNIIFFTVLTLALFFGIPLRFFEKKYTYIFWKYLSLVLDFITSKIGGISFIVENEENLLNEPAIYAIRHESAWETLILIHKFEEPIFILKKELLNVPLFGTLARKAETIEIDRENGVETLVNAVHKVEKLISEGHPIIIFPEGTRASPGKYIPIKRGIALFYKKTNCPVVPVIHNSGTFWPRHGFIKKPGKIRVKFLSPIAPGLSPNVFISKLNDMFGSEIEKMRSIEG
ncbi:MAG: 1-acyl-sn-glycerol-3-phosphate acyltransferase [Holosporaceae bacterium]|jgi:1-acyl-sn-glycerol-3-phosphate acyltransferase|nr:1-acyl-sn-glycerol-3-phosphate acyltransferase [Holosporaceae bacterium]